MLRLLSMFLLLTACGALQAAETVIRISEPEAKRTAVARGEPVYPVIAKQMKVVGRVQLELHVDVSGAVERVQILSGNALLTPAAVAAAKRWRFPPPMAEDKPARMVCTLSYDFRL